MEILCGVEKVKRHPLKPYSELVCDFLDSYSNAIRHDNEAKQYSDVLTFAFWARKGSIIPKKEAYYKKNSDELRIGKGIVFHIAPSNVPINCMFTYAFGLLAGNSNVVRVPSKDFSQLGCMLRILNSVLEEEKFLDIKEMTSFVRYDRNESELTKLYSQNCNIRVIWGGDETIRTIRKFELPPRASEITFADRYSFGIINAEEVLKSTDNELSALATAFCNDTYLMDQNACSSPHLICFEKGNLTDARVREATERFWSGVAIAAERYGIEDIKVSDKYTDLCECVMLDENITEVKRYNNILYVCSLSKLPDDVIDKCRGRYGMFYEYVCDGLKVLDFCMDEKVQTCAVYGVDENEIKKHIADGGFLGVDRVVPFGKTLNIDTNWDGYDLISTMSRIVG